MATTGDGHRRAEAADEFDRAWRVMVQELGSGRVHVVEDGLTLHDAEASLDALDLDASDEYGWVEYHAGPTRAEAWWAYRESHPFGPDW